MFKNSAVFLFCFVLLFGVSVLPTSPAFALDIVVDDDTVIDDSVALTLANRVMVMELLSDSLLDGASDFQITKSNVSSLDEWCDYVITSILSDANNAVDGFNDFKQNFNNGVLNVYNTIKDGVVSGIDTLDELLGGSSGQYISHPLDNNHFALRGLRLLSTGSSVVTPQPDPDFSSLVSYIVGYRMSSSDSRNWSSADYYKGSSDSYSYFASKSLPFSVFMPNGLSSISTNSFASGSNWRTSDVASIYLYKDDDSDQYLAMYTAPYKSTFTKNGSFNGGNNTKFVNASYGQSVITYDHNVVNSSTPFSGAQTSFAGKSTAINYVYQHFRHCTLYVDGQLWGLASGTSSPTPSSLDIGGGTVINQFNYPVQYKFSEPTSIDYEKLYQIIKKAFNDGDRTDLTTITNGDVYINSNNNTVVTPSLDIDVGDLDLDLVNTFLKYCSIPVFETAALAPLLSVAVAGNIVATSAVSPIPSDILLVFGGFFVLLLFVFMIHRMIE